MSDLRVLVEDEEFGEDFYVHTTIEAVFAALRNADWPSVYRVPDGEGRIKVLLSDKPPKNSGVWLCVRVGDE